MPSFTSIAFQQGGVNQPSGGSVGSANEFGGGLNLNKFKKIGSKLFKRGKKNKGSVAKKDLASDVVKKPSKLSRIKEGMKNKSFSDIKKNAPDSKTMKKQMAKEVGKRVLKKAAKTALGAGLTYGAHIATGGDPLSLKDMKDLTSDASVGIVKHALNGNMSEKAVKGEMVGSYNRIMVRRGGKPVKDFSETMKKLSRLRQRLNTAHNIRHTELHGNRNIMALDAKPFGSGGVKKNKKNKKSKRSVKSGKKPVKKKKKAKKPKKKTAKKKTNKGKGGNFNVMKNVKNVRRIRDVFDV